MKRLALLLCLPLAAQTARLIDPATPGFEVTTYSSATPAQVTFRTPPNWSTGQLIYCIGMRGAPQLRGAWKVKSIAGNVVAAMSTSDVDIPGSTGTPIDLSPQEPGIQAGWCGAAAPRTFRANPRGRIPYAGSTEHTRIVDPDSTGSGVAPWMSDPLNAQFLTDYSNRLAGVSGQSGYVSDPSAGCDGVTAALCPVEEAKIVANNSDGIGYGYHLNDLALGWYGDRSKTHFLQGVIYYLNNFQRWDVFARSNGGIFSAVDESLEGDNSDYSEFSAFAVLEAYSIVRDQMTSDQRTAFLKKYFDDKTQGCANMLGAFSSDKWITCTGLTCQISSATGLTAGDRINVKYATRIYGIDSGSLVDITCTGTACTATFDAAALVPRTGTVLIENSGVSGLDGWKSGTITGQTLTFNSTVAAGTYTTAGMLLVARGAGNDRANRRWAIVQSVNTGATPHEITVLFPEENNNDDPTPYPSGVYRAAWAKVTPWADGYCGRAWFGLHHEAHAIVRDQRTGKPAGAGTITSTTLTVDTGSWPEFADLTPPYDINVGFEIMTVTAANAGTRTLTVTRGQKWTTPIAWTVNSVIRTSASGGAFYAQSSQGEYQVAVGRYLENKTASFIPPLLVALLAAGNDHPNVIPMLEFYWNLHTLFHWRMQRASMAGPLYSGPGAPGYYFGRWANYPDYFVAAALHSFTEAFDFRATGWRKANDWFIRRLLPGALNVIVPWSDSSTALRDVTGEQDDIGPHTFTASYLWPNDDSVKAVVDFWRREWNWTGISTGQGRQFSSRILFYDPNRATTPYDTQPLTRVWTQTDGAWVGILNAGAAARTGWKGAFSNYVVECVPGGDHHGSYMCLCFLQISRGQAPLMEGTASGGSVGTDARSQAGIAFTDTATGGQGTNSFAFTGRDVPRSKEWSDGLYIEGHSKNRDGVSMYVSAANVDLHRRAVVLWTPPSGQDYAIVYDQITSTTAGASTPKYSNWPYSWRSNTSGNVAQSPVGTYVRDGNHATLTSAQHGQALDTTSLLPSDGTFEDIAFTNGVRWRITQTGSTNTEFLAVQQPRAIANPYIAPALATSSSGYRVVQLPGLIVAFNRSTAAVAGLNIQPAAYAGLAQIIITGLTSQSPYTLYSATCDGAPVVTDEQVGVDGTLRFEAAHCTTLSVSSTGSAPLDFATTSPLPQGTINQPYSLQFQGIGGAQPYTFTRTSGTLPTGVTLTSAGLLSGTPSNSGSFSFDVRIQDAEGANLASTFALTIGATTPTLTVTTSSLPTGTVGQPYSATLAASGGTPPYTWAITSGTLPAGLSLAGATISGTPSTDGASPLTVRVTDAVAATASRALSLTINPTAPSTLSARVVALGSTAAIIELRDANLRGGTAITGTVVEGNNTISANSPDGPAVRTVLVQGLSSATQYTGTWTYAAESAQVEFTTLADAGSGPLSLRLRPGIGTQVRASWAVPGGSAQGEQLVACSTGCEINWTGLARGSLVEVTYVATDGSGVAVTRPATVQVIVP